MAEPTISCVQTTVGLSQAILLYSPAHASCVQVQSLPSRLRIPTLYSESSFMSYSCMYLCMYVEICNLSTLYWTLHLFIICLNWRNGPASGLNEYSRKEKKKTIYELSQTIISNILTMSVLRQLFTVFGN